MSKKLGLALGSGGSRGVAHVGFLQALEEAGITPSYISGCSMGAVVGGCFAAGMTAAEMKDIVLSLKAGDLVDVTPAFIKKKSLFRGKKMTDLIAKYLGDVKIEELKIPFRCVATDLYSGEIYVFGEGSLAKAVQASSTIPGVFPPVEHEGRYLVDGGCLCRVPVREVKELGAEAVVAVDVLANASEPVDKIDNILNLFLRVFDVMDSRLTDANRLLAGEDCDLYLRPEIKGMSQYVVKDLDRAYNEGYALGKENIEKIKELLG